MRNWIRAMMLAAVTAAAPACTPADPEHAVAPAKAHELVAQGALLIDVRSGIEYWWSHVDGAVNISAGDLPEAMRGFDKARPIIVYSRSGARSAQARNLLREAGFDAYDLGAKRNW